jgi:hypothetical protein
MTMDDNEMECCGPGFASSQYPRGSTDKNQSMFPFERKMAEAIEARTGKTNVPANKPTGFKFEGPGSNDI